MDQAPLFAMDDPTPLPRAASLRRDSAGPVRWTAYRPVHRVQCDECVLVVHEHDGRGPIPRAARWRRADASGVLLLCSEHAEKWKADQG